MVGAWTCELLEAATHVAALVLEIQRALGGPPLFAGIRRDGAAPLIGSSRAIRQVRERIEQVAVPDFTIECPRLCRGIRYYSYRLRWSVDMKPGTRTGRRAGLAFAWPPQDAMVRCRATHGAQSRRSARPLRD